MDSLELEDSGEHQPSLEVFLASDVIYDDAPVCPCIGSEHQAEIPNLSTEDERQQLMTSSLGSVLPGFDYPVTIGLAIPVMWEPSVAHKEEELERQHSSESEARVISQDEDSRVTSVCATSNDMSDHDSTYQDPHPVVPSDHVDSGSNLAHDENLTLCSTQEALSFTNKPMMQQGEVDQFTPLPCASTSLWSGIEAECFLLGLYIFGKNLSLLSRFVGNKTIGDVLSYYYGKFYKRDAYRRWADCRKARTRRCILGERIFTSWRQQEIISRLKSILVDEAHDPLAEIFKSFNDGQTSLEDFAFALKSTVGTEAFVEAVGIGKQKHDLTGFVVDPSKPNQVLSHPDMPTGKDCSSLASEDIIKFLTGDFRRSKTRSNDLFWEAVWPRLLARGWRSEQPKDVSTTKNSLVFLVPGIKKFSRSKLTKGTHYFDSVSDVLKRVAADPILLDMEVGGRSNDVTADQNGYDTDMKPSQDGPLDGNQELPRFTIIDTTLVRGEEPFRVRELRGLPADAKVRSVPSRHSRKVVSVSSSSEELVADGRLSDDQEYHGQVTADVDDTEILSVYNVKKETQVDSLQNMVTASCSDFPVNGHSSNDSGNKIDLTSLFEPKTKKAERRKYLSPVSKRRRLSSCNNDQTSRRSIPFSKGIGSAKEKIKPLSTSSKPIVGDVCGKYKIKAVGRCSTEKPCEQITDASASNTLNNDRSNEKMGVKKLNEDKSFERKVMPEVHSKITAPEAKFAKGAQVSSLVGQVKQEKPVDSMTGPIVCVTLSDDDDYMMAEEAPSISNSHQVHEPEVAERPASPQPDLALQAENSRRHGTRNRPPTAKALEALALGLLGGKRKGEPKSPGPSRPSQRAHKTRKSSKGSVRTPAGSDTDKSSMDADAQHHINILDD